MNAGCDTQWYSKIPANGKKKKFTFLTSHFFSFVASSLCIMTQHCSSITIYLGIRQDKQLLGEFEATDSWEEGTQCFKICCKISENSKIIDLLLHHISCANMETYCRYMQTLVLSGKWWIDGVEVQQSTWFAQRKCTCGTSDTHSVLRLDYWWLQMPQGPGLAVHQLAWEMWLHANLFGKYNIGRDKILPAVILWQ